MAEVYAITDSYGRTKAADSKNEYYLATAFHKLKQQFIYKYTLFGFSAGLRGGIEVDFVLLPFKIPVELFGEYWHRGQLGADDKLKLQREMIEFGFETIVFWGAETDTFEHALASARKKIK